MKHSDSTKYPDVKGRVFSISRLKFAFDSGQSLPSDFALGGIYSCFDSKVQLYHPCGVVDLPEKLLEVGEGDWVVVNVRREDLLPGSSPQIDRNRNRAIFRVQTIESYQVMVPSGGAVRVDADFPGGIAAQWSKFILAVRGYFHSRGFLEVTSPSLVQNPGMEPELEPFSTVWRHGSQKQKLYLPTSPELHLKQLMAQGYTDIFEIKSVFRNEELTPLHEPEFQMIEWYRGLANLELIERDLLELIAFLQDQLFSSRQSIEVLKFSVADVFEKHLRFRLTPQTTREQLLQLIQDSAGSYSQYSWNDLFHLLWVTKVEPQLPQEPFLLCDYPPSQAALSRLNDRGWADRFEFYWRGVEIANAFHELSDPVEQRRRFERDQKLRMDYGRTPLEIDENFMRALVRGLPPSSGIALGLDRLFMVMMGLSTIQQTRAFSVEHQIGNLGPTNPC